MMIWASQGMKSLLEQYRSFIRENIWKDSFCGPPDLHVGETEEHSAAKMYSRNMPNWPDAGSVQTLGEVVVVKFSNEY